MKKIFQVDENNQLTRLSESEYLKEAVLQELIESHPELIPSTEINGDESKLILVKREMGIQDSEYGSNRWSIDHLFINSNGVPVLVEIKRSTDTRIRREVIGQIFDYAAHATSYWEIEKLTEEFSSDKQKMIELDLFIQKETPYEDHNQFWESVESNLRSGKIIMLIIADLIPKELKRIIEFLNEQLSPSEIYGIEIKQFKSEKIRTLVPTVIGSTSKAEIKKRVKSSTTPSMTEDEYLESLKISNPNHFTELNHFLDKLKSDFEIKYTGGFGGKANVYIVTDELKIGFLSIWKNGTIEFFFDQLFKKKSDSESLLQEVLVTINELVNSEVRGRRPHVSLGIFDNKEEFLSLNKSIAKIKEIATHNKL